MRILILHNKYIWPGGEDASVDEQVRLLRNHGHEVFAHIVDNQTLVEQGRLRTLLALWRGAWSKESYKKISALVREIQPDIVHVHNFWFALSASVFAAVRARGVPVVATLHNFRLLCASGVLLNNRGQACDKCVGRSVWPGVWGRCYHGSFPASLMVARMIMRGRRRGTWKRDVDLFLVPSRFCREQIRKGIGINARVCAPGVELVKGNGQKAKGEDMPHFAFVGRLSREKGLFTLMEAWKQVEDKTSARLRVIGNGPLRAELEQAAHDLRVDFAGQLGTTEVSDELEACRALVLPSECYETFGRVVVEAYSHSRPAIVSRMGGPSELVDHGQTGLLFAPGDANDLARKIMDLLHDPEQCENMGKNAREKYEQEFTPEAGYERLMRAYETILQTGPEQVDSNR